MIDPGRGVPGGRVKEKEEEREEAKREAENLLVQCVDPLAQKEGVNIKKEVVEESDSLAKSIIGYAKKSDMDVIVIGTKGMTAVEDFFLGSITNDVIRHVSDDCVQ